MQMALDEAVLASSIGPALEPGPRHDPPEAASLRVYRWDQPTLSIGAHTELPTDARQRCDAAGVAVVRRPTGGGCVLHRGDLTYCVVAPDGGRGVLEAYTWVAGGLIAGLAHLGIPAEIARHPAQRGVLNCFREATGADLSVDGRKLCGSAQLRRGGWFLQHGSIPLAPVQGDVSRLLGDDPDITSTCLEFVKPGTTWEDLAGALLAGFATAWGVGLGSRALRPREMALAREVLAREGTAPAGKNP